MRREGTNADVNSTLVDKRKKVTLMTAAGTRKQDGGVDVDWVNGGSILLNDELVGLAAASQVRVVHVGPRHVRHGRKAVRMQQRQRRGTQTWTIRRVSTSGQYCSVVWRLTYAHLCLSYSCPSRPCKVYKG